MQAMMAASFVAVNFSLSSRMLRKKVKSEEVLEMMVFEVTLVRASDRLNVNCARNHMGVACGGTEQETHAACI